MILNTPDRVKSFDRPSVWLEFSPLAQKTKSINLGQGFPDWSPPSFIEDSAKNCVVGHKYSSYARSAGQMNLVKEISKNYSPNLNHSINYNDEVLVTVGATEALYLCIMSFIGKNDDVIVIEPAFDVYYGALAMAEANVKPVSLIETKKKTLTANELELDWDTLELKLSKKTKAIILNTPHNPSGKVFSLEELERLARILKKFPNCLVISDEVYEHITYNDTKHISMASLDGMYDRTLSLFSAGKTFSVTGWKIGWIIGPRRLLSRLKISQQWIVFSVATPLQESIAEGLKVASNKYRGHDSFYSWLKQDYLKKRDKLYLALKRLGFNPILPEGSFFILCDISHMNIDYKDDLSRIDKLNSDGHIHRDPNTLSLSDYNFCRSLSLNAKVTAIPTSAFYTEGHKKLGEKWIRFAFCKDDMILDQAIFNLENWIGT